MRASRVTQRYPKGRVARIGVMNRTIGKVRRELVLEQLRHCTTACIILRRDSNLSVDFKCSMHLCLTLANDT